MFVGVNVGDVETRALEAGDLCLGFAADVVGVHLAAKNGRAGSQGARSGRSCRQGREERDFGGVEHGDAVGEDDVAADAEG